MSSSSDLESSATKAPRRKPEGRELNNEELFDYGRKRLRSYRTGNLLGEGSESQVKSVISRETGERFALKCTPKPVGPLELKSRFEAAGRRLWDLLTPILLRHPQFPYFKESFETNETEYGVMEVFQSDLETFLKKHKHLEESPVAKVMALLLGALHQLHKFGCFHRDIKTTNLFLRNKEDPASLVVGDLTSMYVSSSLGPGPTSRPHPELLGSSISPKGSLVETDNLLEMSSPEFCTTVTGTSLYLAPEIVLGVPYSSKADIWSAGVVCFEMLFGLNPFRKEPSAVDLFRAISKGDIQIPDHPPVSDSGKSFVRRLLQPDPAKRPTAIEALADLWIEEHCEELPIDLTDDDATLEPVIGPNLLVDSSAVGSDSTLVDTAGVEVEFDEETGTLVIVDSRIGRVSERRRAADSGVVSESKNNHDSIYSSNGSDESI